MINKTFLIAGGASLASLALGGAAGYLVAKKKFETLLVETVARENAATKKHYAIKLMEAQSGKPEKATDLVITQDVAAIANAVLEDLDADDPEEPVVTEISKEESRKLRKDANVALTNYQAYSEKPGTTNGVQQHNVFETNKDKNKRPLPPRGDGGRFRPRSEVQSPPSEIEPEQITAEEYLENPMEFLQETLRYFRRNATLLDINNDPVDVDKVGQVFLTLFPEVPDGHDSFIYVRNQVLGTEWEIKLMRNDITTYLGLGDTPHDTSEDDEEEEELDPSAYL